MKRPLAAMTLTLLITTACTEQHGPSQQLIETYTAVVLAREQGPDTTAAQANVRAVMKKNGYTPESLEAELRTMSRNPDTFRALYDSINIRLQAARQRATDARH